MTVQQIQLNSLTNFSQLPAGALANIYHTTQASDKPFVPKENPDYVFRRELLRDILAFHNSNHVAMKLTGPKGCGKTTLPEQFYSALGVPMLSQTCDQTMDRTTFIGSWVLTNEISDDMKKAGAVYNGKNDTGLKGMLANIATSISSQPRMKFVLGSVMLAAKNGWPVLLNEYNALDPNAATCLNDLLEGKSVFLEQIGETITPKRGFKVYATMNPESAGLYQGRHQQDTANDDRFWGVEVQYPAPEVEEKIVANIFQKAGTDSAMAEAYAKGLVDIANKVRALYMGNNDAASAIEETISTRALTRWAELMIMFKGAAASGISPLHYALERSVTNHCKSPETKNAIHQIVFEVMAEEWKK